MARADGGGEGGWLSVNIFYAGGKRKAWNLHSNWRVSDAREDKRWDGKGDEVSVDRTADTTGHDEQRTEIVLCQDNDDDDAFLCASDMLIMRNFIVLSRVYKKHS